MGPPRALRAEEAEKRGPRRPCKRRAALAGTEKGGGREFWWGVGEGGTCGSSRGRGNKDGISEYGARRRRKGAAGAPGVRPTHTGLIPSVKGQAFCFGDRLKLVRHGAWATAIVAPESVGSVTTIGQKVEDGQARVRTQSVIGARHRRAHQRPSPKPVHMPQRALAGFPCPARAGPDRRACHPLSQPRWQRRRPRRTPTASGRLR